MPEKKIRYGQYPGAIRRRHRQIPYSDVIVAERGLAARRSRLRLIDVHRPVTPYASVRLSEQGSGMVFMEKVLRGHPMMPLDLADW
jgi:hypothetical protein